MIFEGLKLLLSAQFGEGLILGEETNGLQPALLINPKQIAEVCLFLRDCPETYFDFLACLTGVDLSFGKPFWCGLSFVVAPFSNAADTQSQYRKTG